MKALRNLLLGLIAFAEQNWPEVSARKDNKSSAFTSQFLIPDFNAVVVTYKKWMMEFLIFYYEEC